MTNGIESLPLRPSRLQIGLFIAILVLTLALSLYDWNGYQVGTYGDDGSYVTNTDSLLARVSYGTLLFPGENRVTQFPFFFPMMLAPVRALFPNSLDALRIVPLVATLLAIVVLFWGWRRIGGGLSYWWGLAVTAVTALSPITILHARTVMSEAPFLLLSLLMIVWVEKIANTKTLPRRWWIGLGVLAVLMMYTRSIGWIFVGVWIAYLFWKRGRTILPQMAVAVISGAVLLAVVLLTTTVRPIDLLPQEYLAQFNSVVEGPRGVQTGNGTVTPQNVSTHGYVESVFLAVMLHLDLADKLPYQMEKVVTDWTDAHELAILRYLPGLIAVALWCLGMVAWFRKTGLTAFQLVVLPYLALLFLWAWNGARLFYPVQPQLILAFLFGLFVVVQWLATRVRLPHVRARLAAGVTTAVCVVLLIGCVILDATFTRAMLLPGDPMARAEILETKIPAGAVVLSTRAVSDHLYVARVFIDVPTRLRSTQELIAYMERHAVEYVASNDGINTSDANGRLRISTVNRFVVALDPLIKSGAVETVFEDAPNDFAIYRVNREVLGRLLP